MPSLTSKVSFHFLIKPFFLPKRKELKLFIEQLFTMEKKSLAHISYIFCSDDYLLKINQEYLQHDFYTDIITFDLTEENGIIGEVYISVDRIKENAKKYSSSFLVESHRVIFHGALHLCNYEDKTKANKLIMTKKEDYYLTLFNIIKVPQKTVS
jgi:rRNA maturation RNase YbeY